MKKTDDEIRAIAGHPDCTPAIFLEWFLRGWRACERGGAETFGDMAARMDDLQIELATTEKDKLQCEKDLIALNLLGQERDRLEKEVDDLMYMAEGLRYDHQESARNELFIKCNNIRARIDELNKNIKLFS